jgi:acetyl esterase/lipase
MVLGIGLFGSLAMAMQETQTVSSISNREVEVIKLWPMGLPAGAAEVAQETADKLDAESDREHIRFVDQPEMHYYPAGGDHRSKTVIVIFPGGGYNVLAWSKEGTEIAEWLSSIGVHAVVVKYRVPRRNNTDFHREPLQDAQRAISLTRANAQRWGIDPNQVGVLGFSAGGHLSVSTGVFRERTYEAMDEADKRDVAPNFMCLIYAAYLGEQYSDDRAELGQWLKIEEGFPATFMAVTADDRMRGAQAALLTARLNESKIPVEAHIWQIGGHGYGMRGDTVVAKEWPRRLQDWLRVNRRLGTGEEAK